MWGVLRSGRRGTSTVSGRTDRQISDLHPNLNLISFKIPQENFNIAASKMTHEVVPGSSGKSKRVSTERVAANEVDEWNKSESGHEMQQPSIFGS